ncbi:hypothetical protein H6F77_16910 [Microcoleus sp. FACHB-831]|uniref:KGK domain-containing protein n=1 Tax=Microcoleus sp. FACHB-831 TaxID=2692827 RepID=UPI001684F19D|nr:KGK domain-containing protein [Microcoleus sp. FACHB-831]MBD1922737.1 hypothetical protein [Microcoleus sp. FACHB-831]
MNDEFYPLENCDDDVVLLNQDTFKISKLKELVKQNIHTKWYTDTYNYQTNKPGGSISNLFSNVSIGVVPIQLSEIKYSGVIDCQILRIGARGWEKGKLRIHGNIIAKEVCLEFCPDKPKEPESPLDDIRKMLKDEQ